MMSAGNVLSHALAAEQIESLSSKSFSECARLPLAESGVSNSGRNQRLTSSGFDVKNFQPLSDEVRTEAGKNILVTRVGSLNFMFHSKGVAVV